MRRDIFLVVFKIHIAAPRLPACGARAGDIEREDRDVIHALPDFCPLDVSVAGIGVNGECRWRNLSHRVFAALQLHGKICFHVTADVGRVAVIFGDVQIFVRHAAHGSLQRIDFREHRMKIKDPQHFCHASHYHHVRRLFIALGSFGQPIEPRTKHIRAFFGATPNDLTLYITHHSLLANRLWRIAYGILLMAYRL